MKVSFSALELGLSLLPVIGISLAPEKFVEGGGGFLDDVDVTFLALKFITSEGTPYEKADKKSVPLLKIDMLPDGTQDVQTQYFSCGQLDQWAPSPDGETLIPQSDRAREAGSINKSCNAALFLISLHQAGVPPSVLDSEKVSDLAGIKAHLVRNKRNDNIKRAAGEKEPTVLTVSRIISTPWGGATPAATSPAQATAKAIASGAGATTAVQRVQIGNGVFGDNELAMLAMAVLSEHGGTLKKLVLIQEVYKAAVAGAVSSDAKDPSGGPARLSLNQRLYNDTFLQSQPYWRYDGTTVTLQ